MRVDEQHRQDIRREVRQSIGEEPVIAAARSSWPPALADPAHPGPSAQTVIKPLLPLPQSSWEAWSSEKNAVRAAKHQQRETHELKNLLHSGAESLRLTEAEYYSLGKQAAAKQVEVELAHADNNVSADERQALEAQAVALHARAERAARQYDDLGTRLRDAVDELGTADKLNARRTAQAADAKFHRAQWHKLQGAKGYSDERVAVLKTAQIDAHRQLALIETHASQAVKDFSHALDHHMGLEALPTVRRVLDVDGARKATEKVSEQLSKLQIQLSSLRASLAEAKRCEAEADAKFDPIWTQYKPAIAAANKAVALASNSNAPVPLGLSADAYRKLIVAAVERDDAKLAVDIQTAHVQRLEAIEQKLLLSFHDAFNALNAVESAAGHVSHLADALAADAARLGQSVDHRQTVAGLRDGNTALAAQALDRFDSSTDVLNRLIDLELNIELRRPLIVEGLTYSGTQGNAGYPDIPPDLWPNPQRVLRDKKTNELVLVNGEPVALKNKYPSSWHERLALNLPRIRQKTNAFEKLTRSQLVPGMFRPSALLVERANIPGGYERFLNDFHNHAAQDYGHRAANATQTELLKHLTRKARVNDTGGLTLNGVRMLLGEAFDSVAHLRFVFALRPVVSLQEMTDPSTRYMNGSISHGCCGLGAGGTLAGHYSGVDAGKVHYERAEATDIEMARQYDILVEGHYGSVAREAKAAQDIRQAVEARRVAKNAGDRVGEKRWEKAEDKARATWKQAHQDAAMLLRSAARVDVSMTGFNPASPDVLRHPRKFMRDNPGRISATGEITLRKEQVELLLGDDAVTPEAAALKHFMEFADETGMAVLIHCDWGRHDIHAEDHRPVHSKIAYEHFDPLIEMAKRYKNAQIVLAHTGLGRAVRPDTRPVDVNVVINGRAVNLKGVPTHVAKLYEVMARAPNVKFDISWSDVAQAYLHDPAMRKALVQFIIDFQDRIIFGSDTVMPFNAGMYNQAATSWSPLFKDIALRDPEALWKIAYANYAEVLDAAGVKVANWARREWGEDHPKITKMDHFNGLLKGERAAMAVEARIAFDAWVQQLYKNELKLHASRLGLSDETIAAMPIYRKAALESEAAAVDRKNPDPQGHLHWEGDAHGRGTSRGKQEDNWSRSRSAGVMLGMGGAFIGGAEIAHSHLVDPLHGGSDAGHSIVADVHHGAYEARAGLHLLRAALLGQQRMHVEKGFEEFQWNNEDFDHYMNRIERYGRAFNIAEDRLIEAARLTEQARVDYALIANKPLDPDNGFTQEQRFNLLGAVIGEYQISLDRALGLQANSLTAFDPRTRPGQLWRGAAAASLAINAVASAHDAFDPDPNKTMLERSIHFGFALGNGLGIVTPLAGIGSGLMKNNWEARLPGRWLPAISSAVTMGTGGLLSYADALTLWNKSYHHIYHLTNPGELLFDIGKFGASVVFAAGTAKLLEPQLRGAARLPMQNPTDASTAVIVAAAATALRVGFMMAENRAGEAGDTTDVVSPGTLGIEESSAGKEQREEAASTQPDASAPQLPAPDPQGIPQADALRPKSLPDPRVLPVQPTKPARTAEPAKLGASPRKDDGAKMAAHARGKRASSFPPVDNHHQAAQAWWLEQEKVRGHHFHPPIVRQDEPQPAWQPDAEPPQDDDQYEWVQSGDNLWKIAERHAADLTDDGNVGNALKALMTINAPVFHFNPHLMGKQRTGKGDPDRIWAGMLLKVSAKH